MKKKLGLSIIVILGIFVFFVGSIIQAQAVQERYSLIMDEYGPGLYKNLDLPGGDVWHVWNGALNSDPWIGGESLMYTANHRNFTGYFDVLVKDPNEEVSDMLRFSNNPSYPLWTFIRFYSADTGGGAPADTGLPPSNTWQVGVDDTVYEDANGIFHWTDLSGDQFTGYSTPEPTTMLLLVLGLMGLAGVRRKFKK
jgi:hypothetical protein